MRNSLTEDVIRSPLEMDEIERRQINLRHRILLSLILIIGVALRIWNINWDLPEIYKEAYLFRTAWNLFQLGKLKEALMVVNRSLQLNPNKAEMIALRGSILLRSGNLNEAEENLTQALTLNDRLEIAYLDLELLYRASKNTQKAVDILTRYLKILPPESETAKLTIEHIQELKNKQKTPL